MLGLVWTPEDLQVLADQELKKKGNKTLKEMASEGPSDEPTLLRYPLSLLVRPELLKSLQERALPSAGGGLFGMSHVPSDAMSLAQASKEEFLKRMGAQSAYKDDFDTSKVDAFGPSQRGRGGFGDGPTRPISNGRRR